MLTVGIKLAVFIIILDFFNTVTVIVKLFTVILPVI